VSHFGVATYLEERRVMMQDWANKLNEWKTHARKDAN